MFLPSLADAAADPSSRTPVEPDPDRWLQKAPQHEGSWWPKWAEWLIPRSGAERQPPGALGNLDYPPLGPAPGTYVHELGACAAAGVRCRRAEWG